MDGWTGVTGRGGDGEGCRDEVSGSLCHMQAVVSPSFNNQRSAPHRLSQLIETNSLRPHPYADQMQTYGFCPPADILITLDRAVACASVVLSPVLNYTRVVF